MEWISLDFGLSSVIKHYRECDSEFILNEQSSGNVIMEIFGKINYTCVTENDSESQKKKDLEMDVFYNFSNFIECLEQEDYV